MSGILNNAIFSRRALFFGLALAPTLVALGGRAWGMEPWGESISLETTLDNLSTYVFRDLRWPICGLVALAGVPVFFWAERGRQKAMLMWGGVLAFGLAPYLITLSRRFLTGE
jgi:hypothetical protein